MIAKKILIYSLCLLPSICLAQEEIKQKFNPVSTAVISQSIVGDARSSALGGSGVSTEPDANSQAWNAAKYPFSIGKAGLSINYTPWLRSIVNDIDLAYVAGFVRLGDYQAISSSLRYFSLGEVTYSGQDVTIRPYEFAFDIAYSRMLSEKFSAAVGLRYLYSDLHQGRNDQTTSGKSFAADISLFYNTYLMMGNRECMLNLGACVSNMGSKISYGTDESYFLPTKLNLGATYTIPFDEYNRFALTFEANKLLVPTIPFQNEGESAEDYHARLQKDYIDQSTVAGIFKSFTDAPGGFKEELDEIQWSVGAEYTYNDKFSLRGGYHHESESKGNLKYYTLGAGFKMNVFQVDASYLIATTPSNPLDQTLRISLSFDLDGIKDLFSRK